MLLLWNIEIMTTLIFLSLTELSGFLIMLSREIYYMEKIDSIAPCTGLHGTRARSNIWRLHTPVERAWVLSRVHEITDCWVADIHFWVLNCPHTDLIGIIGLLDNPTWQLYTHWKLESNSIYQSPLKLRPKPIILRFVRRNKWRS